MGQIQNIERIREGVLPNIFGYGDIKIFLNASSGIKKFNTLPNVKFHFRCLSRQKEARRSADFHSTKNNRVQQDLNIKDTRTEIPINLKTKSIMDKYIPIEN